MQLNRNTNSKQFSSWKKGSEFTVYMSLIFNLMRKLREEELERVELPNVVSS